MHLMAYVLLTVTLLAFCMVDSRILLNMHGLSNTYEQASRKVLGQKHLSNVQKDDILRLLTDIELERLRLVQESTYKTLFELKEQYLKEEKKIEMERERENEIYNTYLVSRHKSSSILRDFLTMRY